MKLRIPKRQPGMPSAEAFLTQFCTALDQGIPSLRTALLVAGVVAAALRAGESADYLFITGLLFHWAIWFENWWGSARSR
jgi:hypothetical protein